MNCEDPTGLEGCVAAMAAKGGGTVVLAEQTYLLTKSLILKDNVAIEGQGSKTVITWDDSVKGTIDEALLYTTKVEGVSLKNFSLACTIDQSPTSSDLRNDHIGLYFECGGDPTLDEATNCNDLSLEKLEVAYCSHGIHIKGATGVSALDLNLHDNGNTEVDFFHNIYLRRVADIVMKQSSPTSGGFYDSPRGHGIRISYLRNAYFEGLAVYGNADHGVHFAERIQNVRMNSMNIHDNCANPNGSCHETFCYGTECEIDYDAPKEP